MYTPIIGLEIHLQLKTKSKVFCKCRTKEAEPNTNICPICLGYPGAMPNLNKAAVLQSIKMGLALNCAIAEETNWDRKSYMYPDLFKGFQISQLDQPICGESEIEVLIRDRRNYYSKDNYTKKIGIFRAHLEEDTAKSIHEENETLLDGNKAGFPLLEIVSKPDMHTADEAVSYAKTVRNLARWFGVSDCNLELGQMRFDASISIALEEFDANKSFDEWKGIKHTPIVEIKNLNSFANLQDALDYEIKRQIEEYEKTKEEYSHGSKETRGWNDKTRQTYTQRKKEEANEYRFIPEPDIPTLVIKKEEIKKIKEEMYKHPTAIKEELIKHNISAQTANILVEDRLAYGIFTFLILNQENVEIHNKVANLITNDLASEINYFNSINQPIPTEYLIALQRIIAYLASGELNNNELKNILKDHKQGNNDWNELLNKILSTEKVDPKQILEKAMSENPGVVEQIKSGKESAKMFFVGIIMRETKGKADANEVKKMIDEILG